jgi:hypothetical protein
VPGTAGLLKWPGLGRPAPHGPRSRSRGLLKPAELTYRENRTELAAFASYKAELGGGIERNNGEAAVLAWISVNGGTAQPRKA